MLNDVDPAQVRCMDYGCQSPAQGPVCVFCVCTLRMQSPGSRLQTPGEDREPKMPVTNQTRDFPGSPVVKTAPSHAGAMGSIPGQGAQIPHDSW